MPREFRVVHLVSRGVAGVRSGWDTADGAVHHEVVSWRESPATLSRADVVVAHGLAPLVVAQAVAGTGPRIVYRLVNSTRATRRRVRRGLHADWVAAPNRRSGWATAAALGLGRDQLSIFRNDDRAAWDEVVARLRQLDEWEKEPVPEPEHDDDEGDWAHPTAGFTDRPDRGPNRIEPVIAATGPDLLFPSSPRSLSRRLRPVPGPAARGRAPTGPPLVVASESPVPEFGAGEFGAVELGERESLPGAAPRLAVGVVAPTSPGHPWWMYRRIAAPVAEPGPGNGNGTNGNGTNGNGTGHTSNGRAQLPPGHDGSPGAPPSPGPDEGSVQIMNASGRSGVGFFFLGAATLAIVAVCTQLGTIGEGPLLVPLAGLFLTIAAVRHLSGKRPEEEWIGQWLILGLFAKILASYLNYYTVIVTYHGKGDALDYDNVGRQYANAWLNGGAAPVLKDLRETNFLRWFTGVVYYVFGAKLLTGTFVFGLLAFLGSYFWYRATVDAVPGIDRRLYLGFVLFAPSILFWPAIVGKEALMQFALGVLALGVSFVLRQHLLRGLLIAGAAGWLVWVVRPHLLALVAIAVGAAYLAGRIRKDGKKAGLLGRPIGIVIIALLVAFTIGQGAQFLGIKSLSFNSIQQELDQESANTANGHSSFHKSGNSLSPIMWPTDAVTVFLRPFPWEIQSSLQILASLESAALAVLIVLRFKSLRLAFARSRESPFLMFCLILTGLYAIAFSSFSNFGLLVRERSLVLPALLVLLSYTAPSSSDRGNASGLAEPFADRVT